MSKTEYFFFWGLGKDYDENSTWQEIIDRLEELSREVDDGAAEDVYQVGKAADKR